MQFNPSVYDLWVFRRRSQRVEFLVLRTSQTKADRHFNGGRFWQILSGVFQSALFEYSDTYLINRTVAPGLVLTSVTPQLDPPGSTFYPRAKQLDLGLAKTFRVGKATIIPTIEFFNVMNSNTVQTWVTAFGPNLHNVNTNMLGRLIRPQLTVNW